MVPMGDNMNHTCIAVIYETISVERSIMEPEIYNTHGYDFSMLEETLNKLRYPLVKNSISDPNIINIDIDQQDGDA